MKKKYTVTSGHLKKDTKEAKKIVSASEKIEKLGKGIIKTDKKTMKKKC